MSGGLKPVILIVDDDAAVRWSIRAYLEDYEYTVIEAENGRFGIEKYQREQIDLMLLDLHMPEVDGFGVLGEVRKTNPDLPMIVISGAGDVDDVVRALRLGATDYITKPIGDMSILLHGIEKSLERFHLIQDNKRYQGLLEAEVAEKTRELTTLYNRLQKVIESTKKLIGCGAIEKSGPTILKEFAYHLKARGGSFYEVTDNELHWIYSIDYGHAVDSLEVPLPVGTILARAFEAKEPFIVDDVMADGCSMSGWDGYSSPSCIIFPFWNHSGKVFAILSLHNPEDGKFALHDREIGAILASFAAEALQTADAEASAKRNEEMMLQSQKLEAVGTLAGGIAHDFNNILSAIVGYTDLSLFSPDLPLQFKKNLEQVKKASQRARDLVHQILSFSRIEESRITAIDLVPVVAEALKLLRASIPSSIKIEKNVPKGLGMIKGDPGRVHQVLMNLCTNAAHAMQGQDGVLTIELARVATERTNKDLGQLAGKTCLQLTVQDTGKGIPPEVVGRIFDPYYTTKEKGEGTGLGLAMVHGIVRAAGGVVTVKSELGKGSVFHVYFPCAEKAEESHSQAADFAMPKGNERILFVDDEETLAEMAGEMLKKLGYTVDIMTSSIAARELLETKTDQYDLVITDQTMPGLSGIELAKAIREKAPSMPVILYSGYSAAISEKEAEHIGIRKVLMKPLSMTLLSQAVRQILDDGILS